MHESLRQNFRCLCQLFSCCLNVCRLSKDLSTSAKSKNLKLVLSKAEVSKPVPHIFDKGYIWQLTIFKYILLNLRDTAVNSTNFPRLIPQIWVFILQISNCFWKVCWGEVPEPDRQFPPHPPALPPQKSTPTAFPTILDKINRQKKIASTPATPHTNHFSDTTCSTSTKMTANKVK